MKPIYFLIVGLIGISNSFSSAEQVQIEFVYSDDHRVDFSKTKGSLSVGAFKDERAGDNPTLITEMNFGSNSDGYFAELPIAEMMQDALAQGFRKGGASLVESDADFTIAGSILAIDAVEVERQGVANIQLTFRTKLELRGGGRTIWQTTLFGRGRTPVENGIVPAVQEALSRTIRELVRDDYFKMEII